MSISWYDAMFNPQKVAEERERQKARERLDLLQKLKIGRQKLATSEKFLKQKQKEYLFHMKKSRTQRDVVKYGKLHRMCDLKLNTVSEIMVNIENQILNVELGEFTLESHKIIDYCDKFYANLFEHVTPDQIETKILDINDKEVISSEMETTLSTPFSTSSAMHEDTDETLKYVNDLLGSSSSSSSNNSNDADLGEKISQFPSIPSSSLISFTESSIPSSKHKKLSKKSKKLADMNIF